MNKKTALFSILTISMLILPSFLGIAYAGKVKTRSASATYEAIPTSPGDFQVNILNTGDVQIVSITIQVGSGAHVSNTWGVSEGWTQSYNGPGDYNTLYATAKGKAVLRGGEYGSFTFNIDSGTINYVAFWAYDRKGNIVTNGYAVLQS